MLEVQIKLYFVFDERTTLSWIQVVWTCTQGYANIIISKKKFVL